MSRHVTMKWNIRNIDRMARLFDIKFEWNGTFTSKIGNGYKMARDGRYITFVFTDMNRRSKA